MWDDHGNRYDMMNGNGAMMGFGVLVLILVVVVALIAVLATLYLQVRSGQGTTGVPTDPPEHEARRLVDRRLALGEVTIEEYASVRAALEA